jgi:cysteinyl-tRNA synthetase
MVTDAGGEKMSKSVGNFVNLTDLLEQVDGRAYRLLVLQSHYRSPMQVTDTTIERAVNTLGGLDAFGRRFAGVVPEAKNDAVVQQFIELLDDDFKTPPAVASIFELVTEANKAADAGDDDTARAHAATALELLGVLGLPVTGTDEVDDATAELVNRRNEARANKDWAEADRLRDELVDMGWTVEDGPAGTTVHR